MGEILFHLFLVCGLGVFYVEATNINVARTTDIIGAAGFPKAIILLALVLTLVSLYKTFKKYMANSEKKQSKNQLNIQFFGIIITILLFIGLASFIGFIFSALILMISVMLILGQKSIKKVFLISVIASSTFTVVFGNLLHVPLPRGISFIKELSFLIY